MEAVCAAERRALRRHRHTTTFKASSALLFLVVVETVSFVSSNQRRVASDFNEIQLTGWAILKGALASEIFSVQWRKSASRSRISKYLQRQSLDIGHKPRTQIGEHRSMRRL